MKSYLAAVRHEQISMGLGDPHITQMPQLEYVLKGVKRLAISETHERFPITPSILRQIKKVWKKSVRNQDFKMLWTASCLCSLAFCIQYRRQCPQKRNMIQ